MWKKIIVIDAQAACPLITLMPYFYKNKQWLLKKIINHISSLLACMACIIHSAGQTLHFQSYTTLDGLSQNSIYSIAQTKEGFMWFGTQDGLNRFDGKSFFLTDLSQNGEKKHSKMVTALLADNKDYLWVGTTQEILIYDRYINRFTAPANVYKGFALPGKPYITKLWQDNGNNIWILTQKHGIFQYDVVHKKMNIITAGQNTAAEIISATSDKSGVIWACSKTTVYKWQTQKFTPLTVSPGLKKITEIYAVNNELWLLDNTSGIFILNTANTDISVSPVLFQHLYTGTKYLTDPRIIHQSDSNTVWVGSRSEGIIKIDLTEKKFINSGQPGTPSSLVSPFCLSFYTSPQGITWVGLSGGIAKYDKNKTQFGLWKTETIPGQEVYDNRVFSIHSSNNEDFYMGTLFSGIHHLNIKSNNSWYYFPPGLKNNNTESKNIYDIVEGDSNSLWIASWAGLYNYNLSTGLFKRYFDEKDDKTIRLTSLLHLKGINKILAGGYNNDLRLFNTSTKKWEHCYDPGHVTDSVTFRIRFMKEMDNGNIYMCTEAQNFICYNYISGLFTFYPAFQQISNTSRYFYKKGKNLWIATDDGLIQADAATMHIKKVWTTADGLPNNYIYAVLSDEYGYIWITTNNGLAMINTDNGIIEKFSVNDGLQGMEFNTAACFKDKLNRLWFGGIDGLNMVQPKFSSGYDYSPAPLITKINVMNTPLQSDTMYPYLHTVTLPFTKNFINFEFQAPGFSQSENTVYQYMLTGVDTGWVHSNTKNYATYTQLKPGSYVFKVKSANSKNIWSVEAAQIKIIIQPAWYQTYWFTGLLAIFCAAVTYWLIKKRIKIIKDKAELKSKITEIEMSALKAQMNPHFMFNCINSIDAFIHTNDKYNATLYLNKFAKLLRNILDSSKQNTVALTKDIETLKLYIELEELRHENKFKTSITIDDTLLTNDYKVPPLIIQPFVENAILHGLKNREDNDGLLQININKVNDKIEYLIKDNGIGRKAAAFISQNKESSYGMQMSNDRIKLFNQEEKPSVQITDLYNETKAAGTEVKVLLNIL